MNDDGVAARLGRKHPPGPESFWKKRHDECWIFDGCSDCGMTRTWYFCSSSFLRVTICGRQRSFELDQRSHWLNSAQMFLTPLLIGVDAVVRWKFTQWDPLFQESSVWCSIGSVSIAKMVPNRTRRLKMWRKWERHPFFSHFSLENGGF